VRSHPYPFRDPHDEAKRHFSSPLDLAVPLALLFPTPQVWLGGVRVGEGLGVGSLILTPVGFLLVAFLAFLEVGGVSVAFHLLARVLEDPTLGPFDDALLALIKHRFHAPTC
jgi:hypothetical protein